MYDDIGDTESRMKRLVNAVVMGDFNRIVGGGSANKYARPIGLGKRS